MQRRIFFLLSFLTVLCLAGYITLARVAKTRGAGFVTSASTRATQGALQIVDPEKGIVADCPLKHTDVKAEISGFISRVVVTQEFENPLKEKIEAVYVFPLPQMAAVDDMTMRVGDRTVRGRIKRREEARAYTKRHGPPATSRACSIRSGPTSSLNRSRTLCPAKKST